MRALLWVVTLAATLWCGYWFVGQRGMLNAAERWFADQTARGLVAENRSLSVAGFPNRFDLMIDAPRIGDRQAGIVWQAPFAQVFTMSWKPWHIIAAFPNAQQITTPQQDLTLASSRMQASMVLVPGLALTLDRTRMIASDLDLASSLGWAISAKELRIATAADPSLANAHHLGAEASALTLDAATVAAIATSGLPSAIDLIRIDATAGLSAPLDRHAAETRPRLTDLHLREALIRWGDARAAAEGTLAVASDGRPEGRINIRVSNWRRLLSAAVALELVSAEVAPTVEKLLEAMAAGNGATEDLVLPLTFQSGRMSLGPLPLGPAPRLN